MISEGADIRLTACSKIECRYLNLEIFSLKITRKVIVSLHLFEYLERDPKANNLRSNFSSQLNLLQFTKMFIQSAVLV